MKWIKTSDTFFPKSEIIATEYHEATTLQIANLTVYLRGGAQIRIKDREAEYVWEKLTNESKFDDLF